MSPSSRAQALKSILLVDDDPAQLKIYEDLLSRNLGQRKKARIKAVRFPADALILAKKKLFDIILIDVTINYYDNSFGGLELYSQLIGRYGSDSLILYSQYVTEGWFRRYPHIVNFHETSDNPIHFVNEISVKAISMRKTHKCFVAMPFEEGYESIWRTVEEASKAASFVPIRVDKRHFNDSIIDFIISELREAKVVVFVALDRNPNVFYEAGFAHALEKEIITVTDDHSSLPFDVRDRNAIAFGKDLKKLKSLLSLRLRQVGNL